VNRLERLLVLVGLVLVLLGLLALRPGPAALGAAAGLVAGIAAAGRIGRLRAKVEARIGEDEPPPPRGIRRSVLVNRAASLATVLVVLWIGTLLVPFAGERAFAAVAAAATTLPAVLTARRLVSRR
jgi:hypothetical protein